jgi:hypothetical protein
VLAQVASVVELAGLQIGTFRDELGQGGFAQDVSGHVRDGGIDNFVDETDTSVFARDDPRDTSRRVISGSTMASRPRRP